MAKGLIHFRIIALFALFGFIARIEAQQPNAFNYDVTKPPCCHSECCCTTCDEKLCKKPPPSVQQQMAPMSNDGKTDGLFQAIVWNAICTCETTSSFQCTVKAPNQTGPGIVLPPGQDHPYPSGGSYPSIPGSYQTIPQIIIPPGGNIPGGYQTGPQIVLPPGGNIPGSYQTVPRIIIPPGGNNPGSYQTGSIIVQPGGASGGSYASNGGYGNTYVQPVRPNGSIEIWPGYPTQPIPGSYPAQPPSPSYPGKPPTIDITPGCQSPPCQPGGQTPGGQVDIIPPAQGWIPGGSQAVNVRTKTVWTKDCNCEISKKTYCKPIVPCPGRPGGGYPLPPPPGPQPPAPSYPVYPPSYPINPPSGPGEYVVGPITSPPATPSTQAPPATTEEPDFWSNTAAVILMIVGIILLILVCILGGLILWFVMSKSKKSQPVQQPRHSSRRHSVEPTEHPAISNPQLMSSSQPAVRDYEVGGTNGEYRQQRY